jgi:hypothetical protein
MEDSLSGSLEERGAGPGKRGTKLQGRGGSAESPTRLGVGSDREEQEEKTALYNHMLASVPAPRMNAGTMHVHVCA